MIVVRDVFRVKFGKSKEATELFKQALAVAERGGFGAPGTRLLTDLVGEPYYTLIMEATYASMAAWEQAVQVMRGSTEFRNLYQKIVPLMDGGERKMYAVVE